MIKYCTCIYKLPGLVAQAGIAIVVNAQKA